MRPTQKATLENNHHALRDICPKKKDLRKLGLTCQEAANVMMTHINSTPLRRFNGKSALQMAKDNYFDLYERLEAMGVHLIPSGKVFHTLEILAPFRED